MATILELVLEEKVLPFTVVRWLAKKAHQAENLDELERERFEFIPFFLNYLRDKTVHLLQNNKSACPSPAKTPTSFQNKQKPAPKVGNKSKERNNSSKRVQLFSVGPTSDRQKTSPSAFELANTSLDSPHINRSFGSSAKKETFAKDTVSGLEFRRLDDSNASFDNPSVFKGQEEHNSPEVYGKRNKNSRSTPVHSTPDSYSRSKHKHSLGDFLISPETEGRKKKSPFSGNRNNNNENSPSPVSQRRSGGKGKSHKQRYSDVDRNPPKLPGFSLTDAEDFPTLTCNSQSQSKPRRITPTPVNQDVKRATNTLFTSAPALSPVKEKEKEKNAGSRRVPLLKLDDFRESLKEENAKRNEVASNGTECNTFTTPSKSRSGITSFTPNKTPSKYSMERQASIVEITVAEPCNVTFRDKLHLIAEVYSGCLEEHLVPSITVELYFIMQLLTARGVDLEVAKSMGNLDWDETSYFHSVHNAVYFAVVVLELQIRLVQYLDKGTLKLLSENQRIEDFSVQLKTQLTNIYEESSVEPMSVFYASPIGGVSFQVDTDNRKNFPSDKAFHLFKKQRDIFYELVREWEENHLDVSWSLSQLHGHRIRSLVSCPVDLVNHIHFARLFQAQLIAMCKGVGTLKSQDEDTNIALLSQLKRSNPEKFKKLQERFTTPTTHLGPCPPPSFPGCQEFFRDFIVAAESHVFNQHLIDGMAAKIKELINSTLSDHEDEVGTETKTNQQDKDVFSSCLLTLRLLGKFLGFIVFLPYRTPEPLPETLEMTYVAMRSQVPCPLDVYQEIQLACVEGRLVLTVPWVVEFLSMMDSLAPRLQYYSSVCKLLMQIHRCFAASFLERYSLNSFLTVVVLGWLFQLPQFPEELFFTDLDSLDCYNKDQNLDSLELVDHPLMYTCCPYLGELRSLLIDFAVGGSTKQNNIRKITPIAAECEDEDTGINEKQLQLQLEENFFHNHPASLKRTVEFVADRVASIHIKKFRSQELPRFISIGIGAVGGMLSGTGSGSPDNRLKTRLEQQVLEVARNLMQTARNDIVSSFTAYCQQKTEAILPMLLPDDTVPQVLAVSMQISARLALEKVTHWSQAHLTTNMLNKEMTSELDKLVRSMASGLYSPVRPVKGEKTVQVVHGNPAIVVQTKDVCAVSETINMLKDYVRDLVLEKDGVSYQRMLKLLRQTKDTFFGTANIFPLAYKTVALLWLDLAVSCAIFKPPYITEESLGDLTALWQGPLKQHTSFCQVICAKYVHLLMTKSKVLQESWNQYAFLLRHLLNQELLTWADVKEAGLKLLQQNLPKDCLELFAACICDSCKVFSEDKTMGTIDCLELLNSLDQECANCSSVTIQAVKDCISIISEQQLLQDTKCTTEKMAEIADIGATTGNTLHDTLHPKDEKHQPKIMADEQEQNKNPIKVECDCVHTEKYCQKCTLCFNKENQTEISSCDEKILPKVDSMQVKIAGI